MKIDHKKKNQIHRKEEEEEEEGEKSKAGTCRLISQDSLDPVVAD